MGDQINLEKINAAIVFGSSGDIGRSLIDELFLRNQNLKIFALIKNESKKNLVHKNATPIIINSLEESSWEKAKELISKKVDCVDLFISTVGFLHNKDYGPEKALKKISYEGMLASFESNYLSNALFSKFVESFISKSSSSSLVFLSAKVGSIEDNKIGGWYSYRASKAALNMLIKTASIEFKRKKTPITVLSIHPGTTKTKLSAPFLKGVKHQVWSSRQTAKHILKVVESKKYSDSGQFFNWDNTPLPW